jgi:hypothetical protein
MAYNQFLGKVGVPYNKNKPDLFSQLFVANDSFTPK